MSELDNGLQPINDIEETQDESGNDTTDWKAKAYELYSQAKKYEGVAKRNYSDYKKLKDDPRLKESAKEEKIENKKEGFDYGEKAYLTARQVEPEYFSFVEEVMKSTGKSLEEVLDNKYFQNDLAEKRAAKKTADALPKGGSDRGGQTAKDSVDYWINKGELPPEEMRQLRYAVVKEKIKRDTDGNKFTPRSIV